MSKTRMCKTLAETAIVAGDVYFEDVRQCSLQDAAAVDILDDPHLKSIRLVSLSSNWQQRVYLDHAVVVEKIKFDMTLRKERRGQRDHWYAYRRVLGTLHKRYVGDSSQITEDRLLQIAQAMPSL